MAVNPGFSKAYVCTMAAATGSCTVTLPEGFRVAYLLVASCSSSSALDVYGTVDSGTTYYQMRHNPPESTSTVMAPSFIVAASAMVNGALVPIPAGMLGYKFVATDSNPAGALGFKVLGIE